MKLILQITILILFSCSKSNLIDPLGIEMVLVEKGSFSLGCVEGDNSCKNDEALYKAEIDRDFLISRYEVSQELYLKVVGSNPSKYKSPMNPVDSVDWYDAVEFCNKLSLMSGFQPAYFIDKKRWDPNNKLAEDRKGWVVNLISNSNGYRLPTEKEWEFAAKGGNRSRKYIYSGSNNPIKVAIVKRDIGPEKVGSLKPNELGIYDMSGNLFEWCHSWYSPYENDNSVGKRKVVRGGSWFHHKVMARSSKRSYRRPDYGDGLVGFRIVRSF